MYNTLAISLLIILGLATVPSALFVLFLTLPLFLGVQGVHWWRESIILAIITFGPFPLSMFLYQKERYIYATILVVVSIIVISAFDFYMMAALGSQTGPPVLPGFGYSPWSGNDAFAYISQLTFGVRSGLS